jgi:NHLM bacteriocin system ABC transporter peptidase/ATP-binding protein
MHLLNAITQATSSRRTPLVLQQEAAECGAACLAMVLAHYGAWIPLDELRVRCNVSRNGSKASSIVAAAATFGLIGRGFRHEPETLRSVKLPCVLFWNFNHFVVLDGFDRSGGAKLLDPATGSRTVSAEEFDKAFTGVCLTFEPGPNFVRQGTRPRLLPILRAQLTGVEQSFLLLICFAALGAVPLVVSPVLVRIFVDDVLLRGQLRWVAPLTVAAVVTTVFLLVAMVFRRRLLVAIETWISTAGEGRFIARLFALPLGFFAQRHTGDLVDRLGAFNRFAKVLTGAFAEGLSGAIVAALLLAAAVVVDPLTGLAVLLTAVLTVAGALLAGRAIIARSDLLRRSESLLASATLEGLRLMDSMRAAGRLMDAFSRWSGAQARASQQLAELETIQTRLRAVPQVAVGMMSVAVLAVGGWQAMRGAIGIGQIVALQMIATASLKPLNSIVLGMLAGPEIRADVARVDDVFRHPVDPAPRMAAPAAPKGRLEFRHVSFGYARTEPPVVDDVSFTVEPGRRVALAGSSGSGKSSLAKLASGLFSPWSGEILLDGVPVNGLAPAERAALIGYVDQAVVLFEGTVSENLSLFRPNLPDARATQVLREVGMLTDIEARPDRLEAMGAEYGANFSGGQCQRLEIARAIAANPVVLVLDEATSALDPLVEQEIEANLRRLGITSLVVAHRLSTIRDADEILVMEKGKVIERGRHNELIALGQHYLTLAREFPEAGFEESDIVVTAA